LKSKYLILSVVMALAGFPPQSKASLSLGSAGDFAVLAGTGITVAGAVNSTTITGDIGTNPTSTITGLGNVILNGVNHAGDAVSQQAQTDASTAYTTLKGETGASVLTGDLGNRTLTPGVYSYSTSAQLTGILTLSGAGDFVFQIGSTLGTASSSSILLVNGTQAGNVFWQVGSSATLGTGTSFQGSILADQSITFDTGASMAGSAVALNGAVTLDDNNITITAVPESATLWPLVFCACVFGAWQWLAVWRRKTGRS
jgi:type VI secretion system secreted protein VgrG